MSSDPRQTTYRVDASRASGVLIGDGITVGVINFGPPFSAQEILDQEARRYAEVGLEHLRRRAFRPAAMALRESLSRSPGEPELHYHLALALLAGRSPRRLSPRRVREIEEQLEQATYGERAGHVLVLLAFVKHQFYVLNRLRVRPPQPHDLLAEAHRTGIDGGRLAELRRLAPLDDYLRLEGSR